MGIGGLPKFSGEEDRNNAKLPLPPGQDSQVQVLLRPGLLADVEIVVEKIPNVVHVPSQAVFQKGGKPIVYVQQKTGKFEPREVQLMKQSESMMVLGGGVEAGEVVALADPTAEKGKKEDKKASSNPMSSMPGGEISYVLGRFFPNSRWGWPASLHTKLRSSADDARHDLRRGRGGGHVVRLRAGAQKQTDELHRRTGCEQYHRGRPRSRRPQRIADRSFGIARK